MAETPPLLLPMQTVRQALAVAAGYLDNSSATPRLDAELLLAHALGVSREEMLLDRLDRPVPAGFEALLARRMASEPVAYLTGMRAFWTLELTVTPDVLIPRPDTETLIEAACSRLPKEAAPLILDLGTGSGALLLAALDEWPNATGVGVDRSEAALKVARGNAQRLALAPRAAFVAGDWAKAVTGCFDVIFCNPPYIEEAADLPRDVALYEPVTALYAGADGLDDYRRIMPMVAELLAPAGTVYFEVGAGQAAAVAEIGAAYGLSADFSADLAGHIRCVVLSF